MPNKPLDPKRKPGSHPQSANDGWLRKYWRPALVVLIVAIGIGVWWGASESPASAESAREQTDPQFVMGPGNLSDMQQVATPEQRKERVAQLKAQVDLAETTLCSYRDGTQYPHESRPISEHPDQIYPNMPVQEAKAMRTSDGKADANVQINTSMSHVFVASTESVTFTVKATDQQGKTLPMFITQAIANPITERGSRIGSQVVLPFSDDGINGDSAANDGTFTGVLTPGATSFASFNGTIRIEVKYSVGERTGSVFFDIIYTPETPAVWAGPIREALEEGSLNFYLKADVRQAGRYIVSGRVDDAKGRPFAFVSFNDILGPGPNEIKLTVFGKLLVDKQPAFPLTLRDVDAYLLKENVNPDRALMPRIQGTAYVTKMHTPKNFSDAEWQSEERSRYVNEYTKDLKLAKDSLKKFDPSQPNADFSPGDCKKVLETLKGQAS